MNRDVSRVLDESQVYRIDHYLGKETVQNILALRFGNAIFEPIWNRRHVASVQITVAEEVGMAGGRGAYYDTAGAIRDMVQNHMMQLLCLVAMEPPVDLSADAVRNEKVKVLQALPRWTPEDVARNVVRGQYTAGSIEGKEVPGYLQEKGVEPDSKTEHLRRDAADAEQLAVGGRAVLPPDRQAAAQAGDRDRHPVPPAADRRCSRPRPTATGGANLLVLRIQPNEGASLAFQAKIPGSRRRLQEVRMDFRYGTAFAVPPPEAYERLLLDVMLGDPTLFTRTDEVESAWRFITHDPRRLGTPRRPAARHLRRRHLGPARGRRAARPTGRSGGGCKAGSPVGGCSGGVSDFPKPNFGCPEETRPRESWDPATGTHRACQSMPSLRRKALGREVQARRRRKRIGGLHLNTIRTAPFHVGR